MITSDAAKPSRGVATLAGIVLLLALGFAAYANSLRVPFVLDDTVSILENPTLRHPTLAGVLNPPADAGVGGRPLANASLALNFAVGGAAVSGYHVVNVAIHVVAALLLFATLQRLLRRAVFSPATAGRWSTVIAFGIAAVWLSHPLQTEAVTYLSQRTESLMGLFYLATMYAFVRGADSDRSGWLAASVVACLAGMATKEVMVTAPVMVFLADRTFFAGSFSAAWRRRRWYHLAMIATWLLLAIELAGVSHRGIGYATMTWWEYARLEGYAICHYLRLAAWPWPLVFDYGPAPAATAFTQLAGLAVVLASVAAAGITLWRRPAVGFAALWAFVLLAPTSSVVPVAAQPMAEHRMYLPVLGAIAVMVFGLVRIGGARLTATLLLAAAGAFAVTTHQRNVTYGDAERLWRDTIAKVPGNGRAHAALAVELLHRGQRPAAIREFEAALRLAPNDAEARNNFGTALQDEGRLQDALAQFAASVRLDPDAPKTRYNFGNALLAAGRAADALSQLQRAVALQPQLAEARGALGNALAALGRIPDSVAAYREALRLNPDLPAVHFALANVLSQTGQVTESLPHFDATIRALPDVAEAHFNFGSALLAAGRVDDAIREFQAASRLAPTAPEPHNNLGIALARAGRTTDARAQFEEALRLRPDFTAARQNLADLARLAPAAR